MGIEFILKKGQTFKHRRDKMFAENIQSTNLLSAAPEKTIQQFRCKTEPECTPEVGARVLLFPEAGKVNVLYLNKKIGVMMSPDAVSLKKVLGEAGFVLSSACIVEVRSPVKIFLVQLL